MKIAYLPLEVAGFPQSGMRKALKKLSNEVLFFDFYGEFGRTKSKEKVNQYFINNILSFKPRWLHMQLQESGVIEPSSLVVLKKVFGNQLTITNWTGDIRMEVPKHISDIGKVIDYTLLSNVGQKEMYMNAGCKNVVYWQSGVDTDIYRPLDIPDSAKYNDVVFMGSNYDNFPASNKRKQLMIRLTKEFPKFTAHGWRWDTNNVRCGGQVFFDKANSILNYSKISIGINAINDVERYYSDRTVGSIASGSCHLMHYVPGLEKDGFIDGINVVFYKEIEECVQKAKELLANPERRLSIGRNAVGLTQQNFTFDAKLKELLPQIGLI